MENHKKHTKNLSYAIALALSAPLATAATFNVTEAQDDGTGLVANTLSWAILQANTTVGADIIELNTDVTITGVMKRLIDSDTTLQSDATRRTIDGNNQFRPLFIKSGQVTIQNLDVQNGRAQGGSSSPRGGTGAGLGGGVFVYDGTVSLTNMAISSSVAIGGYFFVGSSGGGGLFGKSSWGAGGGMFGNASGEIGGYGGYGNYRDFDPKFGEGGSSTETGNAHGGFGGGGGYGEYNDGGNGGFGAGGGYGYYGGGGNGGFGAGGGSSDFGINGLPGYGGYLNSAAGFGGAVFVRSGVLNVQNVVIENNQAKKTLYGLTESEGLGGALFVLHTKQNSNGNNQGMPNTLPTVTGCGVTFTNNTADTDPDQPNNNDEIFDLGNRITPYDGNSLTSPCGPPDQEIQVTGNGIEIIDGDVTPDLADGSDLGEEVAGFNQASQTFTIENLGNHPIQLTGDPLVSLTNNNNSQFEISQQPASSVIFGGQSLEFQVTFAPINNGLYTATVVIENNDPDESTYEFQIQGNGLPAEAEMDVKGNGIEIMNGDITPDLADDTDFGTSIIGLETVTKTFTIDNINGNVGLTLTGNPVVELQNNSGQFTVTNQPANNLLEPGQSVTFDVTFTPANEGVDSVTVSITNNDSNENPYDFIIQAEAVEPPPEMDLYGDTFNPIVDGDVTPSTDEGTYLGEAQENGQSITRTFYIDNYWGLGDLILDGNPVIELQNNSGQFAVTLQPDTTVSAGNYTIFEITFTPTVIGNDSTTVVIQNNDPDEAPYDFVIEAEGIPQEGILQIYDNGVPLVNGDDAFFGYVPVTDGEAEKTFEIKNIGFASMDISDPVITQFSGEYSISQNITEYTLDPNESTFVTVKYDPVLVGFAGSGSSLDVGYGNSGYFNFISLYGYGQPTLTINAENNYLQEGESATFVVTSDVVPNQYSSFSWHLSGQVTAEDFGGIDSGGGFVDQNSTSFNIEVPTAQDGIYEGPEIFNITITSNTSRLNIGFPSVSGGVIDDDWIFDDGFEVPTLNQFLMAIGKYAYDLNDSPVCNELACNFLQRSISIDTEQIELVNMVAWFEETLVLKQPNGDWDGDGLPNHHDLNPFGLSEAMLSKIKN